jgi:hypothetical protein
MKSGYICVGVAITYAAMFGDDAGEAFGDFTLRLPAGPRVPNLGLAAKFIAWIFFAISSSTTASFTATQISQSTE